MHKSLCYARKFAYVLQDGDAKAVLSLSIQKRLLVMQSLAALSKYLGCYDLWCDIRKRYQLKWSRVDDLRILTNIANNENTYSKMISWLRETCSKLPKSYGNVLIYCTLTGLRPSEACDSISLIHRDLDNYLKKDTMVLEHYKYPDIFIRKTKKAFISLVSESILDIAKEAFSHSYNSLRLFTERRQIPMQMSYCRKIFATHLRVNGISSEVIDLLQGRTPTSVFSRYYFRPDFDNLGIRNVIEKLYQQII